MGRIKSYKYKHVTFLIISLIVSFFLLKNEQFHSMILGLGNLGYIGAFFAGILFISTYTVAAGGIILMILAEKLSPLELGLIAGLGGVVGDVIIFRFIKDGLLDEIRPLYKRFGGDHISHLLHSKYFGWTMPVLGAIIIASPFPDELGITLMGISKIKTYQFILIAAVLDFASVFLFVSLASVVKI